MVSEPFWHSNPTFGWTRFVSRGGGPGGTDSGFISSYCPGCATCADYCLLLKTGTFGHGVYRFPYYAKCYSRSDGTPPNRVRVSFASQSGTVDLDPALPRLNSSNSSSCWRMISFSIIKYYCIILYIQ